MDGGVAFGAGKAGAPFDPIGFATRPQVALRFLCWLFSTIIFGCIQSKGWSEKTNKCIFNNDSSACSLAKLCGLLGLLFAIALLALEAFFQHISSIKMRRRAVAADMGLSAAWAALCAIVFLYLTVAWSRSPPPLFGEGVNNARAAIAFAFFAAPAWGGCAWFAYVRWQSGSDMAQFANGFEDVAGVGQAPDAAYTAYPQEGYDQGQQGYDQYAAPASANPFAGGGAEYQAPAY